MSTPKKRYNFVGLNREFIPKNEKNKLLYPNYNDSSSNSSEYNSVTISKKRKNAPKTSHYPKALVKYNYNKKSNEKKNLDVSIFPREAFTEKSTEDEHKHNSESNDSLYKNIQNILLPVKAFKLPSKKKFDLSIQPKVFVQFIPRKGEIPRKIIIERTKKKYANFDIENAFYKNNITPEDLYNLLLPNDTSIKTDKIKRSKYADSLKIPLDYFDNTEFETRIIEEWLNIDKKVSELPQQQEDTIPFASIPLPAVAFDYPEWRDCFVIGYNYETNMWNIKWKETTTWYDEEVINSENEDLDEFIIDSMLEDRPKSKITDINENNVEESLNNENNNPEEDSKENGKHNCIPMSRLRFCFKAEDPENFVKRVMYAINEKEKAKKIITYNFYVDCLSTENIQTIPNNMLQKINEYLYRNKAITNNSRNNKLLINSLVKEINIDFERANNKSMFDIEIINKEFKNIFDTIEFPEKSKYDNPKEYGKIVIPNSNFLVNKTNFSFITYLSKEEIIDSFVKIKSECNKLLNQCCFLLSNNNKAMKVEEFEQMQLLSFNSIKSSAIERWYNEIKNIITSNFKKK